MAGWVINRAVLPTTLSLSYLVTPAYVTLSMNLMRYYAWTSVYVIWDQNSVPIYGFVAKGLSDQLNATNRYIHMFRQMAGTVNTTFAYQLTEFQRVSRGKNSSTIIYC